MYCKNCGAILEDGKGFCATCGSPAGAGRQFCANCGAALEQDSAFCTSCGFAADYGAAQQTYTNYGNANQTGQKSTGIPGLDNDWCPEGKEKIVAIVLSLIVGYLGIHNFYLGEIKKGVVRLLLSWCAIGGILALIDFIKMLTGSYVVDPDKYI